MTPSPSNEVSRPAYIQVNEARTRPSREKTKRPGRSLQISSRSQSTRSGLQRKRDCKVCGKVKTHGFVKARLLEVDVYTLVGLKILHIAWRLDSRRRRCSGRKTSNTVVLNLLPACRDLENSWKLEITGAKNFRNFQDSLDFEFESFAV